MYQPANYDEWKACIVFKCGIPLTMDYIEERLTVLKDAGNAFTKHFIHLYGENYHANVVNWFGKARTDLLNKEHYNSLI